MNILSTRFTQQKWLDVPLRRKSALILEDDLDATLKRFQQEFLFEVLGSNHLIALLGSGASLCVQPTSGKKPPSMPRLWDNVQSADVNVFDQVISTVRYNIPPDDRKNIESLLSHCTNWLNFNSDDDVANFVKQAEIVIADSCNFLDEGTELDVHEQFLLRTVWRRIGRARLQLFTTNYDLCIETAASRAHLVSVDGFSHTLPQEYDSSYLDYDLQYENVSGSTGPVPGVFKLYKLHGSVDWCRAGNRIIRRHECDQPVLIFPRDSKYQMSFQQPYLELLSRFQEALRQPNIALIVAGFGFNDLHIVQPIIHAIESNPRLKLIVCDPKVKEGPSDIHKFIAEYIALGDDRLVLMDGRFEDLVTVLPQTPTPSEEEVLYQRTLEVQRKAIALANVS